MQRLEDVFERLHHSYGSKCGGHRSCLVSDAKREGENDCVLQQNLGTPECNYCVIRQKLLALVKAMKHFWPHFYGIQFKL